MYGFDIKFRPISMYIVKVHRDKLMKYDIISLSGVSFSTDNTLL